VVAAEGRLDVGDVVRARMADTRAATLRIAAVYERAAGGEALLAVGAGAITARLALRVSPAEAMRAQE
jgi:hypothetical protein